ncbi:alpha/beta hydrolase [Metabacillus halosaccharovorans]|uniref:alpha/beta hydrolase n=1 Tax=Metabacillus halosaccharovorans TaxID=930124 RepID=UPI002040CAAD|nr:alpha/beta hydrolase [Metabacillus halosaccharovorans]MCM3443389.1 alpha/beta hydrolase [Metabacillus halosaccharovorans]
MPVRTQQTASKTINRTLRTAQLIDGFWERWLVHGIESDDLIKCRQNLNSLEEWLTNWEALAIEKTNQASILEGKGFLEEAEYLYRQASLCYNLNYWIFPDRILEKQDWYKKCLELTYKGDSISSIKTKYDSIYFEGVKCAGRIRIPSNPKGCILIINPIDSSKEELFRYERDFIEDGFVTISFDGPGQGETFALNGLMGTGSNWEIFTMDLIEYAKNKFPTLPLYLFGTSLGATWVLLGSSHPDVKKSVAVSPAVDLNKMNFPSYFEERINIACNLDGKTMPNFKTIDYKCPIFVFHGKKDMMVPTVEMYELFEQLPNGKRLIEYDEEGHCCNNRLDEIRKISLIWFSESEDK